MLESPFGLCVRAREGASFVAEEFALQQGSGNRGAVQLYKRSLAARTLVVNGAGDDFFAGAGFALNQGHGVALGDHANQIQNALKCGAVAHDFLVHQIASPFSSRRRCRVIHSRTYGGQFAN